jgi:CRP-like cAMP-binding protein/ATP/ADP translocase/HEAT repeat protein
MREKFIRLPVQNILSIEKSEYVKTFLLFLYLFFMTAATIIGRTAADTFFLSKFDVTKLSYMYLAISISLSLFGLLYHRIVDRFRKDRLTYFVTSCLILLVLVSRWALDAGVPLIYPMVYVGFEAFNFLLILQFWTFTNDILDTRQAKRLLGVIGSAGILGGMISGFAIKGIVTHIGMYNLVYLYAGGMLLCMLMVRIISTAEQESLEETKQAPAERRTRKKKEPRSIRGIFHLKLIVVTVSIITMVLIFIDYQFKLVLTQHYKNEQLAAFLGQFYGYTGIIALFFQFFISSRILSKFGILVSLLILPVFLLISSATFLMTPYVPAELYIGTLTLNVIPLLWAAVFAKSSDKVFSDTIYSSASQLMYVPIHAEIRGRAKVFVDGIMKPLSKGFGAVLLILSAQFFPLPVEDISYAAALLLIVCIVAMFMVKREYVRSLFSTLKTSRIDFKDINFNVSDSSAIKILEDGLESRDERQVLYCMEALKNIEGFYLLPHLLHLLDHPSPRVRVESLRIMQSVRFREAKQDVIRMLEDENTQVKVQAILTLSSYGDEEQLKRILGYLLAEHAEIKGAAVSGLMEYYGIDGIFYSVDVFKQMLDSPRIGDRLEVARILGRIGVKNFHKPLVKLLEDHSKEVQLAAIESAEQIRVPDLIPNLIKKLKQKETRLKAIEALSAYAFADVVPALRVYLEFSDRYKEISICVPRVFELMASQECADILAANYAHATSYLRGKILESLAKMRFRLRDLAIDHSKVEALIMQEIKEYMFFAQAVGILQTYDGVAILMESIQNVRNQILERIFKLLAFINDPKTITTVYRNLLGDDRRARANAIEVLDNMLSGTIRSSVVDVVNKSFMAEKTGRKNAAQFFETLNELFKKEYDWIRMVIEFITTSPKLEEVDKNLLQSLRARIQETQVGYDRKELVNIIQKVAILKKVNFFSGLSGEFLSTIALNMKSVKTPAGTTVFHEGDEGDSFYIVIKGKVLVHKKETRIVELEGGQVFGEMAILDHEKRSASVTALEDTMLFKLESDTFYDIIADKIEIAKGVIRMLTARLRMQNVKVAGVNKTEKEERTADDIQIVPVRTAEMDSESLLKRILVLKDIDLFASLSDEDVVLLANLIEEVSFNKGQDIFKEGDPGEAMYGIIQGAVLVHKGNTELAVLRDKEYFGEMAVLDNEPRSATVTALKDTTLLKLSSDDFYSLLFDKIEITKSIFAVLVRRLRETSAK